jgi:hypothetical protein
MNEEQFKKMDEGWMKAAEGLREKKVSDGILKGFSASVERRLAGETPRSRPVRALAWAPAVAVVVIASVVVLRSPILSQPTTVLTGTVEYAQLPEPDSLDEEIEALKEVGAWNEADEAFLGAWEETEMGDFELSHLDGSYTTMA